MKRLALLAALIAAPVRAQETDHSHHSAPEETGATDAEQIGNAPPPPVPTDHAADRIFPGERMTKARAMLLQEGRFQTSAVFVDRLEYHAVDGSDGYAWKGEAWTGGDIDRFVLASEGEGNVGGTVENAELRLLWRHAVNPWFNMELGVRHDIRPTPQRTYAVAGIEGLAPYWIAVEGQLMLSDKGDAHARIEANHDMRITQRLILRPEVEANFAFQDVPELGIGAGMADMGLGARLRYQVTPRFAPYVGVQWERKVDKTADFARVAGEKFSGTSLVMGIHAWF